MSSRVHPHYVRGCATHCRCLPGRHIRMEGDERGNDPQTARRGGLIWVNWVNWARGLFSWGKWAELLGKTCNQTSPYGVFGLRLAYLT
jgi:hypothetical protein